MTRFVVLLKFTEKGIMNVKDSVARAAAFRDKAAKVGATVEAQYWTQGPYDGLLILQAPDEATAGAVVLELGKGDAVQTCSLRAFDAEEFAGVVEKVS